MSMKDHSLNNFFNVPNICILLNSKKMFFYIQYTNIISKKNIIGIGFSREWFPCSVIEDFSGLK